MSKAIWTPGQASAEYAKIRSMIPKPLRVKFQELKEYAIAHPISSNRAADLEFADQTVVNYNVAYGDVIVIFTVETHDDGVYHHLTVDRTDNYPQIPEVLAICTIFFGEDESIFMTLPSPKVFFQGPNSVDIWHKKRGNIVLPS